MPEDNFFVVYDVETSEIWGMGHKFPNIPKGKAQAPIEESVALEFISGPLLFHNYFISINEDGRAEALPKGYTSDKRLSKELDQLDNIIRDLNYRLFFFDRFAIKFEQQDKLNLTLDLEKLSLQSKQYFDASIDKDTRCLLYITKYKDPGSLIKTVELDLYQLGIDKKAVIDFSFDEPVSVWGSKLL